MRGYGRDYDDGQRDLSGGSRGYGGRTGARGYDAGGGYRGGQQGGDRWRSRTYAAEPGRGYDRGMQRGYGQRDYTHGDSSRQRPARNRGGQRGAAPDQGGFGADRGGIGPGSGMGYGVGGYRPSGSFSNPVTRGDFFRGYGGGTPRGYTPYW